jgi:uncharacterized protein
MARGEAFLGTGWSFPPTFEAGGSRLRTVAGAEDIEQSLAILLSTSRGERILRDEFGCALNDFLFGEVSRGLMGRMRDVISQAILYHEPRIRVNDINISDNGTEAGMLLIGIDYTVRATNSRYNMVYPFYVNEANVGGG